QPAVAANPGTVLYAGPLGVYGNSVVVNHGMGLTTLYGFLSEASVKSGETVKRGQTVGTIGASGFSEMRALHFQIRVDGVPVRPVEWMDKHWVRDHIERKIQDVKKIVGVESTTQHSAGALEGTPEGVAERGNAATSASEQE